MVGSPSRLCQENISKKNVDGIPGVFDYETVFTDPSVTFTDEEWAALSFERFVELGGTLVVVPDKAALKAHFADMKAACEGKSVYSSSTVYDLNFI